MDTVGTRLLHIRADTSQTEFARQLGVSLRTYWNYEQDKRPPPAEVLRALASLGWNPNWVLSGMGQERLADHEAMRALERADEAEAWGAADHEYSPDIDPDHLPAPHRPPRSRPVDFDDYTFVPHLSVRAGAGNGAVVESEQIVAWMAFRKSYLQMLGVPSSAACLIRVRGHSMDPYLRNGDTILVDTSDTTITRREGVYAFRVDASDELAVKTITLIKNRPGAWRMKGGDNWPEQILEDADKPVILGRVRWSGRTWD